jgi:hypothetical protein
MKEGIYVFEQLKKDKQDEITKREKALKEVLELYKPYSDELYTIITEHAHNGSCGHTLDEFGIPLKMIRKNGIVDRDFWKHIQKLLEEKRDEKNE